MNCCVKGGAFKLEFDGGGGAAEADRGGGFLRALRGPFIAHGHAVGVEFEGAGNVRGACGV